MLQLGGRLGVCWMVETESIESRVQGYHMHGSMQLYAQLADLLDYDGTGGEQTNSLLCLAELAHLVRVQTIGVPHC